ncbi:hypothetical protein [Paenibacillus selenitireducens]|nr:hypothetical protein [Paenibacillus selenitireducens]
MNLWSSPNGGYTFFMFHAERRIYGGDWVRYGGRRRVAGTLYINI